MMSATVISGPANQPVSPSEASQWSRCSAICGRTSMSSTFFIEVFRIGLAKKGARAGIICSTSIRNSGGIAEPSA